MERSKAWDEYADEEYKSNEHQVNELGRAIKIAYESTQLTACSDQEILRRLDEYDLLVDKLVELTNGNEGAYFTDPMQAEDYSALLGKLTAGMTYNDMAEDMGAKFIDGLCGEEVTPYEWGFIEEKIGTLI